MELPLMPSLSVQHRVLSTFMAQVGVILHLQSLASPHVPEAHVTQSLLVPFLPQPLAATDLHPF